MRGSAKAQREFLTLRDLNQRVPANPPARPQRTCVKSSDLQVMSLKRGRAAPLIHPKGRADWRPAAVRKGIPWLRLLPHLKSSLATRPAVR